MVVGVVGVVAVWPATAAASAKVTNVCSAAANLQATADAKQIISLQDHRVWLWRMSERASTCLGHLVI